mmetsp:Transcript_8925/g.23036  ORF Transcript_8925/g.23036 Transcript_8925/m.23036 type:complete len:219 (-) Transcript_8925:556-1212(-)
MPSSSSHIDTICARSATECTKSAQMGRFAPAMLQLEVRPNTKSRTTNVWKWAGSCGTPFMIIANAAVPKILPTSATNGRPRSGSLLAAQSPSSPPNMAPTVLPSCCTPASIPTSTLLKPRSCQYMVMKAKAFQGTAPDIPCNTRKPKEGICRIVRNNPVGSARVRAVELDPSLLGMAHWISTPSMMEQRAICRCANCQPCSGSQSPRGVNTLPCRLTA